VPELPGGDGRAVTASRRQLRSARRRQRLSARRSRCARHAT